MQSRERGEPNMSSKRKEKRYVCCKCGLSVVAVFRQNKPNPTCSCGGLLRNLKRSDRVSKRVSGHKKSPSEKHEARITRVKRYLQFLGYGDLSNVNDFDLTFEFSKVASIPWRKKEIEKANGHKIFLRRICKKGLFPAFGDAFYSSKDWKDLRIEVLEKYGEVCMRCGACDDIAVDHIMPRSLYPELELEFDNLQVLCRSCNSSKSNVSTQDYRTRQHQKETE